MPFNPDPNKKTSVMPLYKFVLNRTFGELRRFGVTEGEQLVLSSKGCVTMANGQSGRSQLLGNTLGTLTLACRREGDP